MISRYVGAQLLDAQLLDSQIPLGTGHPETPRESPAAGCPVSGDPESAADSQFLQLAAWLLLKILNDFKGWLPPMYCGAVSGDPASGDPASGDPASGLPVEKGCYLERLGK